MSTFENICRFVCDKPLIDPSKNIRGGNVRPHQIRHGIQGNRLRDCEKIHDIVMCILFLSTCGYSLSRITSDDLYKCFLSGVTGTVVLSDAVVNVLKNKGLLNRVKNISSLALKTGLLVLGLGTNGTKAIVSCGLLSAICLRNVFTFGRDQNL